MRFLWDVCNKLEEFLVWDFSETFGAQHKSSIIISAQYLNSLLIFMLVSF